MYSSVKEIIINNVKLFKIVSKLFNGSDIQILLNFFIIDCFYKLFLLSILYIVYREYFINWLSILSHVHLNVLHISLQPYKVVNYHYYFIGVKPLPVPAVIAIVFGVIIFVCICVAGYLWYRYRMRSIRGYGEKSKALTADATDIDEIAGLDRDKKQIPVTVL